MMAAGLCSCTKYLDIKPYGQTIPQTAEEFSAIIHLVMTGRSDKSARKKKSRIAIAFEGLKI